MHERQFAVEAYTSEIGQFGFSSCASCRKDASNGSPLPQWQPHLIGGTSIDAEGARVLNNDRADWRQVYSLSSGDVAYVWHGAMHGDVVAAGLVACGFQLRAQIVWTKQHFTLSRGDYHWKHECCWYAVREGKTSHWTGDRTQTEGSEKMSKRECQP